MNSGAGVIFCLRAASAQSYDSGILRASMHFAGVYPFVYPGAKTPCRSVPLRAGFQQPANPLGYLLHSSPCRLMPFRASTCRFSVKQSSPVWGSRGRGFKSRQPDHWKSRLAKDSVAVRILRKMGLRHDLSVRRMETSRSFAFHGGSSAALLHRLFLMSARSIPGAHTTHRLPSF